MQSKHSEIFKVAQRRDNFKIILEMGHVTNDAYNVYDYGIVELMKMFSISRQKARSLAKELDENYENYTNNTLVNLFDKDRKN